MIKTGIVISIMNKKVGIMTSGGEFVYIKTKKVVPNVGEIYSGELYKKNLFLHKYAITAASLMFVLISSVSAYAYYTPVTTIVVSINPSVSLEANRWNKIISSKALNSDGSLILSNIKLKNKSIDVGLELLVNEAKTEHFIDDEYINDEKIISVDIKSDKDGVIDISKFKGAIDDNNLNIKINASSSKNKHIDFTVDNKKIDTSSIISDKKEKEDSNKNSNIKVDLPKKPSVSNNANTKDNNSGKVKEDVKNNNKPTITEVSNTKKDNIKENKKPNNTNVNDTNNNGKTDTDKNNPSTIKNSDDSSKVKKNNK